MKLGETWRTITGVVPDIQQNTSPDRLPLIYIPYAADPRREIFIAVRTQVPASTLTEASRRAVQTLDSNLPLYDIRTLDRRISMNRLNVGALGVIFTIFGAIALVLASSGTLRSERPFRQPAHPRNRSPHGHGRIVTQHLRTGRRARHAANRNRPGVRITGGDRSDPSLTRITGRRIAIRPGNVHQRNRNASHRRSPRLRDPGPASGAGGSGGRVAVRVGA